MASIVSLAVGTKEKNIDMLLTCCLLIFFFASMKRDQKRRDGDKHANRTPEQNENDADALVDDPSGGMPGDIDNDKCKEHVQCVVVRDGHRHELGLAVHSPNAVIAETKNDSRLVPEHVDEPTQVHSRVNTGPRDVKPHGNDPVGDSKSNQRRIVHDHSERHEVKRDLVRVRNALDVIMVLHCTKTMVKIQLLAPRTDS